MLARWSRDDEDGSQRMRLSASPAVPLTLAAAWAVLGTVALVARARDRR